MSDNGEKTYPFLSMAASIVSAAVAAIVFLSLISAITISDLLGTLFFRPKSSKG